MNAVLDQDVTLNWFRHFDARIEQLGNLLTEIRDLLAAQKDLAPQDEWSALEQSEQRQGPVVNHRVIRETSF